MSSLEYHTVHLLQGCIIPLWHLGPWTDRMIYDYKSKLHVVKSFEEIKYCKYIHHKQNVL